MFLVYLSFLLLWSYASLASSTMILRILCFFPMILRISCFWSYASYASSTMILRIFCFFPMILRISCFLWQRPLLSWWMIYSMVLFTLVSTQINTSTQSVRHLYMTFIHEKHILLVNLRPPCICANLVFLAQYLLVWLFQTGSGRVTFNSAQSYAKAVQAAFIEIRTPKFTKKVRHLNLVTLYASVYSLQFDLWPWTFTLTSVISRHYYY